MHLYPSAFQQKAIDATVKDIQRWTQCLESWAMRGYSPRNAEGVLDWYKKGGPPKQGPKQQAGTVDYEEWQNGPTT